MASPAQSIIARAAELLNDLEGVRWPATDLVAHLNDGQRALVAVRPDATASPLDLVLVAGPRQTLPDAVNQLMNIHRNTTGKQRVVRQTTRDVLDAVAPNWTAGQPRAEIIHFMYDPRIPRVFDVYPPAMPGVQVDATVSLLPVDIPAPAGPLAANVTGTIAVNEIHANALLHFVLFRAFAKDAESGGNADLSAAHYSAFTAAIGGQLQASAMVAPTNP